MTFTRDGGRRSMVSSEGDEGRTTPQMVWMVAGPILLLLGTVGNLLSLIVMLRPSLRRTTAGLLLSVLAIVDLLNIWSGLLRHWLIAAFNINIREFTDASCKIHIFVVYFATQFGAWLLVIITLERFTAVYHPHRSRVLFSRKRAALAVTLTGLLLVLANLHFFWTTFMETDEWGDFCDFHPFFENVWSWIDLVLANLAPFIIMISLNAAIVHKLRKLRKLRPTLGGHAVGQHEGQGQTRLGLVRENSDDELTTTREGISQGHAKVHVSKVKVTVSRNRKTSAMTDSGEARQNQLTLLLLTVTFVFFITTLPIAVHIIVANVIFLYDHDPDRRAAIDLSFVICSVLSYTNNAINFLLYCVGGRRFRQELVTMCACARCCRHTGSIGTQPDITQTEQTHFS